MTWPVRCLLLSGPLQTLCNAPDTFKQCAMSASMQQTACKPLRCAASPNLARRQQAAVPHCSSTGEGSETSDGRRSGRLGGAVPAHPPGSASRRLAGAQPPAQQAAAAPSRRQLLRLAAGLPALALPPLAAPLPAAAAAAPGPRYLTPAEQAAVDAAFAATLPKAKVCVRRWLGGQQPCAVGHLPALMSHLVAVRTSSRRASSMQLHGCNCRRPS